MILSHMVAIKKMMKTETDFRKVECDIMFDKIISKT